MPRKPAVLSLNGGQANGGTGIMSSTINIQGKKGNLFALPWKKSTIQFAGESGFAR